MNSRWKPRLSYANVMSSIAVFIALGGGAYATHSHLIRTSDIRNQAVKPTKIARGAIFPAHIRRGSVVPAHIRRQAIFPGHLRNGAVRTDKLADGAVTAEKLSADIEGERGPQGERGPEGMRGPEGPQGPKGDPGSALAFATVASNGDLRTGRSKGFDSADVYRGELGTYCFRNIPDEATAAVATANTIGLSNTTSDVFAAVGFAPQSQAPNTALLAQR